MILANNEKRGYKNYMLDVCLLGTGGMMPLPNRWLTSLMVRMEGSSLLIDCGEGTQIAMKKAGLSANPVDIICITHFHADHISGLPGFLLSMGNADRTEPVTIIGPRGLEKVVNSLRIIAPELPFKLNFIEVEDARGEINIKPYVIEYFKLKHKVTCYGYSIKINRLAQFEVEKAKENQVPLKCWNKLQHGQAVVDRDTGIEYTPDMVMGADRKGLKITYLTDTRPVEIIDEVALDSDLFICEGMYGEEDKVSNAKDYMHMTMQEACKIGAKVKPKEMWLTHYSPSETKPIIYLEELRKICPVVQMVKDGTKKELKFED